MAQIPDWTAVGQQTPQPSYRRVMVDDSAARVDDEISNLGQGLVRTADEVQGTRVNFARSQASTALVDHELAVKQQTEQIRQQVASGQLSWDQAPQAFDKWQQSQQAPQITNLDPLGQEMLQRGMQRNVLGGAQAVQGIATAGRKQAFADNFDTTLNSLGKLAGMPDADIGSINNQIDAYRPQALAAGIPAATVDKAIQDFKDRNWLNQATQRSMEAKDNPQALQQLQHDLTDADGFYAGRLNTEKRDMVLRSVVNDRLILQNRAEHEQDKREAKAQMTIGRMDEQIMSGIPATPDMWEHWQGLTQGTSFADDFKQRLKDEDQVQQVLRQPIEQQQAYVQQRQAQLDQNGGTLLDKANLQRLQGAINQNANLMQKAPLQFAQNRMGTVVQPLDFSALNPPSPVAHALTAAGVVPQAQQSPKDAFAGQIADRMATLKALRTQYGPQIGQLPLLPQEAAQLSTQLGSATPQDRAQMLVGLRNTMNNDDAYQATMRQIAPRSPVTALAGSMVGSSAPASTPVWFDKNYAAKMSDVGRILQGDELLNPNKADAQEKGELKTRVPMPPDGERGMIGLRDDFVNGVGGVSGAKDLFRDRPDLGETYYATFRAADAALRAESGDMTGERNPKIEAQALKIALGNTIDFNGSRVKVPDGMDPTKFRGYVNNAVAAAVKSAGGSDDWAQQIEGYRLREGDITQGREGGSVGSGRYTLMDGTLPKARPDGKGPLLIDLRRQYAPSTAPAPAAAAAAQGP